MIEKNKELIRALVEDVIHGGDLERIPELFAPNYMPHDPSNPGRMGGIEGARRFISMLHAGMSDIRYTIEDMIAEGDLVAVRYRESGAFVGPYHGQMPNARSYELVAIEWFEVKDGRIRRRWGARDSASQARQLGMQ